MVTRHISVAMVVNGLVFRKICNGVSQELYISRYGGRTQLIYGRALEHGGLNLACDGVGLLNLCMLPTPKKIIIHASEEISPLHRVISLVGAFQ